MKDVVCVVQVNIVLVGLLTYVSHIFNAIHLFLFFQPDYGTCKALEENILGRNCDKTLDGLGLELVQGFNDTVFCGNVVYVEYLLIFKLCLFILFIVFIFRFDNTTAVYIEWEGACIQSTCRQCITSLAPTLPNALCEDGRCCYRGNEVIANVGVYSLTYAKESPLFTGFYATIIVLIIVCPIILFLMALIVYYYVKATNSAKEDGREVHFWYDFILDLILW